MKSLKEIIIEKLKLSKDISFGQSSFNDEELRNDYDTVAGAYTKAEKDPFKEKYGVDSNKIRDIQEVILDKLRENRHNKKEFTKTDISNFLRLHSPERYDQYIKYLDQEPIDFVEYLLEYYKERGKNINPGRMSIHDRYILKKISDLQKYLGHK